MSRPNPAARVASNAANDAVRGALIADKAAKKAVAAQQRTEELVPDPHKEMLQELALQEQSAFLHIGPRRNRWRDLVGFESELAEVERRRQELLEEMSALNTELANESSRHSTELADWLDSGKGERPASRAAELEHRIGDLRAEYEAQGVHYQRLLSKRADHVAKNRRRFAADMEKAVEQAEAEAGRLVDELEAKRQELLDLRSTQIWAAIFPHESLANSPASSTLVGAKRLLQERHLPGVNFGLEARNVFALLREDVRFCATISTVEQAAEMQGVTTATLTGREATWQSGETDFYGPPLRAAWAGSAEEQEEASKVSAYTKALNKRLWGTDSAKQ